MDCGNCDCASKSQCKKKGNNYGVVLTEESYISTEVMEVAPAIEHNGCECGTNCACVDCNCGY